MASKSKWLLATMWGCSALRKWLMIVSDASGQLLITL
jgi:hypothetical protein